MLKLFLKFKAIIEFEAIPEMLYSIIIIIIASLARDVAPIDHDHAAQHCPTATGWMYPSASTA